jgi:hypothetical protein
VGRVDLLARLLLCRVGERVTVGVEGTAPVDVELEAFVGPGVVDLDGDLRSLVPVQGDVDRVAGAVRKLFLSGSVVVGVIPLLLARKRCAWRFVARELVCLYDERLRSERTSRLLNGRASRRSTRI